MKKISLRAWVRVLLACWIALALLLVLRWQDLSDFVRWPLAFVEAAIGSDWRIFKISFGAGEEKN